MTLPTDDLTKIHLDAGADDPSQARAELEALVDKVKLILAEDIALRDENNDFTGKQTIVNSAPSLKLEDSDANAHDFWIHANSDNFYILTDRNDDNLWEVPHPFVLNNSTAAGYVYGKEIVTEEAAVGEYASPQRFAIRKPTGTSIPLFNVSNSLPEGLWRSIGGTGTNAIHTWTELDDVPVAAQYIEVLVSMDYRRTSSSFLSMSLYARDRFASLFAGEDSKVANINSAYPIAGSIGITQSFQVRMPVSERTFELYWSALGTGGTSAVESINIRIIGYGI